MGRQLQLLECAHGSLGRREKHQLRGVRHVPRIAEGGGTKDDRYAAASERVEYGVARRRVAHRHEAELRPQVRLIDRLLPAVVAVRIAVAQRACAVAALAGLGDRASCDRMRGAGDQRHERRALRRHHASLPPAHLVGRAHVQGGLVRHRKQVRDPHRPRVEHSRGIDLNAQLDHARPKRVIETEVTSDGRLHLASRRSRRGALERAGVVSAAVEVAIEVDPRARRDYHVITATAAPPRHRVEQRFPHGGVVGNTIGSVDAEQVGSRVWYEVQGSLFVRADVTPRKDMAVDDGVEDVFGRVEQRPAQRRTAPLARGLVRRCGVRTERNDSGWFTRPRNWWQCDDVHTLAGARGGRYGHCGGLR